MLRCRTEIWRVVPAAKRRSWLQSRELSAERPDMLAAKVTDFDDYVELASFTKAAEGPLSRLVTFRQRVILANQGFVHIMARKYGKRCPYEDVVQWGQIGLMKAVDRFEPQRGFAFSTYAGWWIRHSITRSLATCEAPVHVPMHVQYLRPKVSRMSAEGASISEIAAALGQPVHKVRWAKRALQPVVSLDFRPNPTSPPVVESIADPESSEEAPDSFAFDRMHECLDLLGGADRHLLERRYGLNGFASQTLQEMGDVYGLSRERIRQKILVAENRLRSLIEGNGASTRTDPWEQQCAGLSYLPPVMLELHPSGRIRGFRDVLITLLASTYGLDYGLTVTEVHEHTGVDRNVITSTLGLLRREELIVTRNRRHYIRDD